MSMLLPIVQYPDPRLKRTAQPVVEITDEIRTLVERMAATMYAAPGVGLAAPQVGENLRLVVLDPSGPEEQADLRVLINPELTPVGDDMEISPEGCLSVPLNYRADVPRFCKVRVRAQRLDGTEMDEEWDGFAAIIAQHEVDHLSGTLFIDRISRLRRMLYDSRLKKQDKRP